MKQYSILFLFSLMLFSYLSFNVSFISTASANTTYWFNDTFTDETKIESSTDITVSGGDVYLGLSSIWQSNSTMVSGLIDYGSESTPSVFQKDGTWYLIHGVGAGDFYGFNWTGSSWQSDSGIASGLGHHNVDTAPSVFQKDGTWYLISGNDSAMFLGFSWTGSEWQTDSDIISGLTTTVGLVTPSVFQKDGTWYLIHGCVDGDFYGFNWTGAAWQTDSDIISGLSDVGDRSAPSVFQKDGTWYLISGENAGDFYGFNWTGSSWQSDSGIASGLSDVGWQSAPSVFQKDGTWYLISGIDTCNFAGFEWVVYESSGSLTSITNTTVTEGNISSVTPTITDDKPADTTIVYKCSNNNGVGWETVTSGIEHDFTSTGNQFKWKADLTTTNSSATPIISDVAFFIDSNAAPVLTLTTSYVKLENQTVFISDTSSSDADGDTPVYSCNRTDLFTDFSTTTGYGNWTPGTTDSGVYYVDVGVSDGYGGIDNKTLTITINDATPGVPTNLQNTTGNFWVNHTWDAGSNTDSFNVSVNSSWYNTTDTFHNNTEMSAHGWSNISVYGYNSTSSELSSAVTQNTQIPNNPPTAPTLASPANGTNTSDTTPFFDWDPGTDPDDDTLTYDFFLDNESSFSSPLVHTNLSVTTSSFTYADIGVPLSEDTKYWWRVRSNDSAEVSANSTNFNFTLDTTPPVITIDETVLNATSYFKSPVNFSYSITELYHNSTLYNVTNSTAVVVSNTTITANSSFSVYGDGNHTLTIYADDKAGNENSTNLTFKADVTAPTITDTNLSDTQILAGETVTISCTGNDTYTSVGKAKVRVENPKGIAANWTMSCTGDSCTYVYPYTGATGTYLIKYFYVWDSVVGGDGNVNTSSSTLYFNVVPSGGEGGGGGGGGAAAPSPPGEDAAIIEKIAYPIHVVESYLQRFLFYLPFEDPYQPRAYPFRADRPLIGCNSTLGTCRVPDFDNTTFAVIYSPEEDDFLFKTESIDITVWGEGEYTDTAKLDLMVINFGVYVPIWIPFRIGTPQWINYIFKTKADVEGAIWVIGIRLWVLMLIITSVGIVISHHKKKEIQKRYEKYYKGMRRRFRR